MKPSGRRTWAKTCHRIYPPPQWQHGRKFNNQFIPGNINREREAFLEGVMLLSRSEDGTPGGFLEVRAVFASPEYSVSYVFAETLASFGVKWFPVNVKKVLNPRGGRFQPVGITTLYMDFQGMDKPFFINVLVLGGSPSDAGAMLILGKPDLHLIPDHIRRHDGACLFQVQG
jgi:hypothetical protein